jgi:hypothetical protein
LSSIISAFLSVALSAGDDHVSWNVQSYAMSVHSVEVLDHGRRFSKVSKAIRTAVSKRLSYQPAVFLSINANSPFAANLSAQFVKEHADQFVGYVGLLSSGSGAQL